MGSSTGGGSERGTAPPPLVPPAERDISFAGNRMILRLTAEETGGAFAVLDETVPAGWAPPLHAHRRAAELFYVLAGSYTFRLGDTEREAVPGDLVAVPKGAAHTWLAGPEGARSLIVFAPGGMEGYFVALGDRLRDAAPDQAFHDEMLERFAMEILVP